jgi:hypothetical protein
MLLKNKQLPINRQTLIQEQLEIWLNTEYHHPVEQELIDMSNTIISNRSLGMRGLVMTGIMGIHLYDNYHPVHDFYACSPRAIFDEIYPILVKHQIPSSKSAPLDVAKATNKLDINWINGKRDSEVAQTVVKFLKELKERRIEMNRRPNYKAEIAYNEMILTFFNCLKEYTNKNKVAVNDDIAIDFLDIPLSLYEFVTNNPNYGDNPEALVYFILEQINEDKPLTVHGIESSVFSNNRNKPADLWLTDEKDIITNLYEVSVKQINNTRILHLIDSMNGNNHEYMNVNIITILPKLTQSLNVHRPGIHTIEGRYFNFIDLYQFIINTFSLLPFDKHLVILKNMAHYLDHYNIDTKIKQEWNKYFV